MVCRVSGWRMKGFGLRVVRCQGASEHSEFPMASAVCLSGWDFSIYTNPKP